MATAERNPPVLIAREASDLAFRIGQAVQRRLLQCAIGHAAGRNAGTVSADDVTAAVRELDVVAACRAAGVTSDGQATG